MKRGSAAALLLVAVVLAPAARAKPLPPGFAAVQQYVEVVPTTGGSVPVGTHGSAHGAALPAKVVTRLRHAGATGAALEQLASSPSYGAPAAPRTAPRPRKTPARPSQRPTVSQPTATTSHPSAKPLPVRHAHPATQVPAVPGPLTSAGHLFATSTAVQGAAGAAAALMLAGLAGIRLRRRP